MGSLHVQWAIKLCERIKIWWETSVPRSSINSGRSWVSIAGKLLSANVPPKQELGIKISLEAEWPTCPMGLLLKCAGWPSFKQLIQGTKLNLILLRKMSVVGSDDVKDGDWERGKVTQRPPISRGSGPFVPFIYLFSGAPLFPFFCSSGNREHPKTDRRQTKSSKERPFFCQDDNSPHPIVAIFWLISSGAGRSIGKLVTVSARTI